MTKNETIDQVKDVINEHHSTIVSVFAYYCSYGEPLNCNSMRSQKFIKFLRDASLVPEDEI